MSTFDGKVVIITGGALGIGQATAWEFAKEGAMVAIADVNREAGEATVAEVERLGGSGLMLEADVADSSDCRRVVEADRRAVRRRGHPVQQRRNSAACVVYERGGHVGGDVGPHHRREPQELLSHVEVLHPGDAQARRRRHHQHRERSGLQSQPLVPPYAASKGGILSLTRQMSLDYAKDNIRVLAVCPGSIDTPMLRAAAGVVGPDPDEVVGEWGAAHPIGRVGTGQDIANAVLFLASDKASFMTGENVNVDGGYMALGAWATAARD